MKIQQPPERYTPDWLESLDGRTNLAQELRHRRRALSDDLGGMDNLSYQQRSLVDRALFMEMHLQAEEMKLATGKPFDSGKWVQACNSLVGLFNRLGMHRQAKEISLKDYVQKKAKP